MRMKLITTLLLVLGCLTGVDGYSQKVTLNLHAVPVEKLIKEIRRQTGYLFLYKSEQLRSAGKVSVQAESEEWEKVLTQGLLNTPLTFKIVDKTIVILPKPATTGGNDRPSQQQAKDIQVSGTVRSSDNGQPLAGASVKLKDSNRGTATEANGNFTLQVPDSGGILVISFIGYETVELPVSKAGHLKIELKQKETRIDEVVVIGYGTMNRKDVTGAVGKVNIKDLIKAPVRSFDEALAGRIAGVQVASADGQPGAAYNITIRGNNSLTQDNSPLYVIDGFPVENPNNNVIDPNDIESIDILKDASATAIYGARGANGVIVITTKKGKISNPVITYNGSVGFQEKMNKVAVMDPYEFVKFQLDLSPANAILLYLNNGKTLESYKNVKGTDWQDQLLQNGLMHNHYLSVTGGNVNTRYAVSGSVLSQEGIILNSGMKRYQGRFSLDQVISKNVKTGINASYSHVKTFGTVPSQTSFLSSTNLMYSIWGYRPVSGNDSILLDDLNYDPGINASSDNRYNPLITVKNELRNAITNSLMANVWMEYAITRNLTLRVTGGITNNMLKNETFNNSKTRSGDPHLSSTGPNGSIISNPVNSWVNENTITYKKSFNANHLLNVVAGFTAQGVSTKRYGVSAIQLPNESLGLSGLDEGTPQTVTSLSSRNTLSSLLGRVNYQFKGRYLFTASFRADGSSKFAPGNKWSYFPSGAIAWRMSNEPFMKRLSFVSDAKLRISYGVTGNNRVSDFAYLSTLNLVPAVAYSFNNQTPSAGIYPATLGNRDLKWENTSQIDIGYDLGLWKDKVTIGIDAYRKTTYDLLLNAQIPATTGFESAFKNIGKIRNEGLELTLGARIFSNKDVEWTSSFNISFNDSKVLALNDGQEALLSTVSWDQSYNPNYLYLAKLRKPIAQLYGYIWEGNYQYNDFDQAPDGSYVLKSNVPANGNARNVIRPGDIKYRDINGDGTITPLDATVIGRSMPVHTGGFTNNFRYKHFDLNIFFQWSYGNDLFNANRLVFEGAPITLLNQFATYAKRWTPDNQNNELFRAGGGGPRGYAYSSRLVEDGSYLRLKTLSAGYNLPDALLKKFKLKSFRFHVSAQNLVTWTDYSGPDPEVSVKSSALTPGFDYSAYPRARTVTLGVNLSF